MYMQATPHPPHREIELDHYGVSLVSSIDEWYPLHFYNNIGPDICLQQSALGVKKRMGTTAYANTKV
jgi:hypothetical protein